MIESAKKQELFSIYPEWQNYHSNKLQILENSDYDVATFEGIGRFGDQIIDYLRGLGEFEPYKNNWRDYANHWRMEVAKLTGKPEPFKTYDELIDEIQNSWNGSGLKEETIFVVGQKVLASLNIWSETAAKMLVISLFKDRFDIQIEDIRWIEEYFRSQIPQGQCESVDEAINFIKQIADNTEEMVHKRTVGFVQTELFKRSSKGEKYPATASTYPYEWRKFLQTNEGRRLGIYSTIAWWNENFDKPASGWILKSRQAIKSACIEIIESPDFQEFEKDQYGAIEKELSRYIQS